MTRSGLNKRSWSPEPGYLEFNNITKYPGLFCLSTDNLTGFSFLCLLICNCRMAAIAPGIIPASQGVWANSFLLMRLYFLFWKKWCQADFSIHLIGYISIPRPITDVGSYVSWWLLINRSHQNLGTGNNKHSLLLRVCGSLNSSADLSQAWLILAGLPPVPVVSCWVGWELPGLGWPYLLTCLVLAGCQLGWWSD